MEPGDFLPPAVTQGLQVGLFKLHFHLAFHSSDLEPDILACRI
jgi:hypothetical protein